MGQVKTYVQQHDMDIRKPSTIRWFRQLTGKESTKIAYEKIRRRRKQAVDRRYRDLLKAQGRTK